MRQKGLDTEENCEGLEFVVRASGLLGGVEVDLLAGRGGALSDPVDANSLSIVGWGGVGWGGVGFHCFKPK